MQHAIFFTSYFLFRLIFLYFLFPPIIKIHIFSPDIFPGTFGTITHYISGAKKISFRNRFLYLSWRCIGAQVAKIEDRRTNIVSKPYRLDINHVDGRPYLNLSRFPSFNLILAILDVSMAFYINYRWIIHGSCRRHSQDIKTYAEQYVRVSDRLGKNCFEWSSGKRSVMAWVRKSCVCWK